MTAAADLNPTVLDLRRIGASDVPALLGVDPYRTKHHVYARIVHDLAPPRHPDNEEAAAWGHRWEPVVARAWCDRHDVDHDALVRPDSLSIDGRPWQRVSPDFFVSCDPGHLLEVKVTGQRRFDREDWGAEGTHQVPPRIAAQTIAQLEGMRFDPDCCSFHVDADTIDAIDVAVNVGGTKLMTYRVPYDAELGAMIVEACERFWRDHVEKRIPPPATGDAVELEALKLLYRGTGARVPADVDQAALAMRYAVMRQRKNEAIKDFDAATALMIESIGDAGGLTTDKGDVYWSGRRGSTRWKDVAAELAERAGVGKAELEMLCNQHRGEDIRFLRCSINPEEDDTL